MHQFPRLIVAASLALLSGCGIAPPSTTQPAPSSACDTFDFFSKAMYRPRVSVDEINCLNQKGDLGEYTIYTYQDGTVTVYWANSKPINVIGNAPACVLSMFTEMYPARTFSTNECQTKRIWPIPIRQ